MTTNEMLNELVKLARPAESELIDFLADHFGSCAGIDDDNVIYPGNEKQYFLRVTYRHEKVIDTTEGPTCQQSELADLFETVQKGLTPGNQETGLDVFFSGVPIAATISYRDEFQILPVPEDAPMTTNSFAANYPVLLRFAFPGSSNARIRRLREERRGRQLQLLLAVVLEASITWWVRSPGYRWIILPREKQPPEFACCQETYPPPAAWPSYKTLAEGWSAPDTDPSREGRPADFTGQSLTATADFESLLDTFFSLPTDRRNAFLRSAFWLQHASSVVNSCQSAAYAALATAIESLSVLDCHLNHPLAAF